ncbi:hypothetical protein Cgig2_027517 [Carnegiea gigantea]|uniref:Cytochrome P450 n=1 Tax=Carnegiea gigantea TaxID=171969 RepID=A0A9Q1GJK8_9CARY|nr:hypothetical protein Cgig2_027517 [Carnegiea gigantea]
MPARDSGRRKSMSLLSSQRVVVKKALPLILARLRSQPHLTYHPTHFSIDLSSYDSLGSREVKDLVWHMMEEGARPNVSDFFPLLRPLDLQGARRRARGYFCKILGVFEKIIDERLRDQMGTKDDVLGTLLNLVKEDELSLHDVKHMLADLFIAGIDTTLSTVESAMTEMLRHPEKVIQAQAEIDQVLGKHHSNSIQETDISNLPYIRAVVKETLRLHPPALFLVPHKTTMDAKLCGHRVPKDAQVWVNVWSMGRDPSIWHNNQDSFVPEKFLEIDIDVKGRNIELIPFGTGRRICPGMSLAYRMVHLMLAALLHSFNWKLDHGRKGQKKTQPTTMGYYTISSIILLPIIIFILHQFFKNSHSRRAKLSRGPKPRPTIGNIHLLSSKPHRSVANLSKTYTTLMSLRLGSITTIVISSPNVAKEMFFKHDLAFTSRHVPDAIWILDHIESSMCPKWRHLRKISAIQLFTNQQLDASQGLRKKKVNELVKFAKGCCEKGLAIDIGKAAFTASLNLLSNTFFSIDMSSQDSLGLREFNDLVWHVMEEAAMPNALGFARGEEKDSRIFLQNTRSF